MGCGRGCLNAKKHELGSEFVLLARLFRLVKTDSFGVSISAVLSTGLSAISTLFIAKLCGPEVRGILATGFLWLLVSQSFGLRGANFLASRIMIDSPIGTPGANKAMALHRRVVLDVPVVSFVVFTALILTGRLTPSVSFVFCCSSVSLAQVNWTAALLQSQSSLKPLARYRIVATGLPQMAQLLPIAFGVRSALPICAAFSVASILSDRLGLRVAQIDKGAISPSLSTILRRSENGRSKESWSLMASALLQNVAPRADLLFLTAFSTTAAVGRYSLAISLTAACTAMSYVFVVSSFRRGAHRSKWSGRDSFGVLVLGMTAVFWGVACRTGLVWLMGESFAEAAWPACLLCLGTFPAGISLMVSERWRGEGRADFALYVQILSFVTTGIFLMVFVRKGDLAATAWATVTSQLLVAVAVVGKFAKDNLKG
jgi:O-antigen/teichoic acid export membrane protein